MEFTSDIFKKNTKKLKSDISNKRIICDKLF